MNFTFKCKILDDEKNKSAKENILAYLKGFIIEFIAALMLNYFGCGCCIDLPGDNIGFAMCFGMAYASIVQIFYLLNLAHINPVITLSYYIFGMLSLPMMLVFMIAQCMGAITGTYLLKEMSSLELLSIVQTSPRGYCCTIRARGLSTIRAFLWEFGLTCFLILFVCSIVDSRNIGRLDALPLKFGFVVYSLTYVGYIYTGGSMNPARSLGPSLVENLWEDHWIYWVAPFTASIITSVGYHILFLPKDGQDEVVKIFKESSEKNIEPTE